jgi:hypothetical protein
MVAPNYAKRTPSVALDASLKTKSLAERLSWYFAKHPQVSREDFLFSALEQEMDRQSVQDLAIHAWLVERQAIVDRERNGWRAKARRLFPW